jgi:eukaryotic-like serine/threonine-protein kinase
MPEQPAWEESQVVVTAPWSGRDGALLPVLHEIQARFGYIPAPAIPVVAKALNLSRAVGSASSESGFGTTDMAGNVKEWCWNEANNGARVILGGSFGEPEYMFSHSDTQSSWERRPNFGFRCAKLDSPPSPTATARIIVNTLDYMNEKPVSDNVFQAYAAQYAYDKSELNAQVEQTTPPARWSREKVSFDAAYGHERVPIYLFLPAKVPPPFQTVVFFPGAGAFLNDKIDLASIEDLFDFVLKSGRALVVPVYKSQYERKDGFQISGQPPKDFRNHVVAWSQDLGRTLDYLETRKEFDGTRVGYFGSSLGRTEAPILVVVEKRIKVVIVSSGGFYLRHDLPEVDPFNFAPHLTIPVLRLNGRYDASFPPESSERPFFHFLGTPEKDKKQVIYEGGHGVFPRPDAVRECLDWLDKYLGPVRR